MLSLSIDSVVDTKVYLQVLQVLAIRNLKQWFTFLHPCKKNKNSMQIQYLFLCLSCCALQGMLILCVKPIQPHHHNKRRSLWKAGTYHITLWDCMKMVLVLFICEAKTNLNIIKMDRQHNLSANDWQSQKEAHTIPPKWQFPK